MAVDTSANGAGSGVLADGSPSRENLVRALDERVELRRSEGEAMPTIVGHFAVFNVWTEINSRIEGHFMERFAPGAFTKTFQENRPRMKPLFEHGLDPYIGKKVLGPIAVLEEDTTGEKTGKAGAYYEVPMFDTSYNRDLEPGLEAGSYGSSFLFGIYNWKRETRPRRSEHNPRGIEERTITEAFVKEFGPCTFPVYGEATAGLRSLTDEWMRARLLGPEVEALRGQATASIPATLISRAEEREDEQRHERLYQRSVATVASTPWAIEPGALATILSIISERANGVRLSDEEILDRIGARAEGDAPPAAAPVAVLRLFGPIVPHARMMSATSSELASVEGLRTQFRDALASPDVHAILFNMDSPGGDASLIPEFASEIRAARGEKPIVAVANTMAASAAYFIASAADEIVVTPSGMVGSIGTYAAHTDISALQEKAGIKTTLVSSKTSPFKTERNPFEPLTEAAKAEMQAIVDEFNNTFIAAVAKGRDKTTATVRETFGQGRLVLPSKALEAGMVDRIATFDETLARLTKQSAGAQRSEEDNPEPEPSEATTPLEPEPPAATTRTDPMFENREEWLEWISSSKT